jgi:hypothetical protein
MLSLEIEVLLDVEEYGHFGNDDGIPEFLDYISGKLSDKNAYYF